MDNVVLLRTLLCPATKVYEKGSQLIQECIFLKQMRYVFHNHIVGKLQKIYLYKCFDRSEYYITRDIFLVLCNMLGSHLTGVWFSSLYVLDLLEPSNNVTLFYWNTRCDFLYLIVCVLKFGKVRHVSNLVKNKSRIKK